MPNELGVLTRPEAEEKGRTLSLSSVRGREAAGEVFEGKKLGGGGERGGCLTLSVPPPPSEP